MDDFLLRMFDFDARLPRVLRAPYRGAVSLFGLALGWQGKLFIVLLLLTLLILAGPLHGLRLAGKLAGVAMVAGAAGGAVSGLLEPLGRRGRSGNGLRWAISIFTYLMVASILVPVAPFSLPDPAFFWVAGALSLLGATGPLPRHGFPVYTAAGAAHNLLHRTPPGESSEVIPPTLAGPVPRDPEAR